jgi:hypothetical protein
MSARRARCRRSNARFSSHLIGAIDRLDVDAISFPPYCSMYEANGEAASRKKKITFFDSSDRMHRSTAASFIDRSPTVRPSLDDEMRDSRQQQEGYDETDRDVLDASDAAQQSTCGMP